MRSAWLILVIASLMACQEAQDASPMERITFARFYESSMGQRAVVAREFEGGYILLGSRLTPADTTGLLIRTGARGEVLWTSELPGIIPKSLLIGTNSFFVFGDSIHVDPESPNVNDLITQSALLYRISFSGSPTGKMVIADRSPSNRIDYRADALTLNSQNDIITLGTFREPGVTATERPFVAALNANTFDTLWHKHYNVIDRDYVNARTVHYTPDGYVVWASAILKEQQTFERTYLSIPFIRETSVFENNDVFGATTDQKLLVADIQRASVPEFGYGIVGTHAAPSGDNANLFFARVTSSGNFIAGSERYFDGTLSAANMPVAVLESASSDSGEALCATSDGGFVLAGTMSTTPLRGNGGRDIFLVKVNGLGDILWNKVWGGTGDEAIGSITETSDGGLLLCGSRDASGLPAMFLIKTNANGEIQD
ncbi:MAG: hypothetical protein DIU61_007080 [Bacteroidota bacterium]|jgi:hypothetical protein